MESPGKISHYRKTQTPGTQALKTTSQGLMGKKGQTSVNYHIISSPIFNQCVSKSEERELVESTDFTNF